MPPAAAARCRTSRWPRVFEEAGDGGAIAQVAVPRPGNDNVGAGPRLETVDDEGAEKAGAAGDDHALVLPEVHGVRIVPAVSALRAVDELRPADD